MTFVINALPWLHLSVYITDQMVTM